MSAGYAGYAFYAFYDSANVMSNIGIRSACLPV